MANKKNRNKNKTNGNSNNGGKANKVAKVTDKSVEDGYINLDIKKIAIASAVGLTVIAGGYYFWNSGQDNTNKIASTNAVTQEVVKEPTVENNTVAKDLIIDTSNVTKKASFIKYDYKGEPMEVMAVKASDGSIRTAFNTCQVCYSSGRGYYKVQGNNIVCQNCGNVFTADQVGLESGGCNPVPITTTQRTETDGQISVPGEVMKQASGIFKTWKR